MGFNPPYFHIQRNPAHHRYARHCLGRREGHRMRRVFVALQHQPLHPHFLGLLCHLDGAGASLHLRVRPEVNVDVNCALQDTVNIAHGAP